MIKACDPEFERFLREEEAIEEGLRSQRLQRLELLMLS